VLSNIERSAVMAKKRARALFSTEAEDSDELSFKANDILIILAKDVQNTPGWWRCSLENKVIHIISLSEKATEFPLLR